MFVMRVTASEERRAWVRSPCERANHKDLPSRMFSLQIPFAAIPLKSPCRPKSLEFGSLGICSQAPILHALTLLAGVSQVETLSGSQGEFCATAIRPRAPTSLPAMVVMVMTVSPVSMLVSVVAPYHDRRSGHDYRCRVHDGWRRSDDHGHRIHHNRSWVDREPDANGDMDPRVGETRQHQACERQDGGHATYAEHRVYAFHCLSPLCSGGSYVSRGDAQPPILLGNIPLFLTSGCVQDHSFSVDVHTSTCFSVVRHPPDPG